MTTKQIYRIGIDVGSTTLKIIVLNPHNEVLYKEYRRHKTNFTQILTEEIGIIQARYPNVEYAIAVTGSAGMGVSDRTGIGFEQEVVASIEAIRLIAPQTRTMIDLGGEDAKMVFFTKNHQPDIRMNGSCAGGTGAFIDQMADLMHISVEELGELALSYEKIYPIASRCGVFAKTDVQNLIARNVPAADIAMSIFHTVALQSITSLARGCKIEPEILCIGGPLTFIPALRLCFSKVLETRENNLVLPENSAYFPALGVALLAAKQKPIGSLTQVIDKLSAQKTEKHEEALQALFENKASYIAWRQSRHIKQLKQRDLQKGEKVNCYLGIDSGSTTTKILILDELEHIIFSFYATNEGNPLKKVIEGLSKFRAEIALKQVDCRFLASASTGYGEELIKSALNLDYGIVETMAHLSGAQSVDKDVSFVLDIGGQDMKSIFTHQGVIANIELNEACSSGCGSFLQNFAATMNLDLAEFSELACKSQSPSDLGSRCTVFMNSKVKQALRENASLADIAAGLAYSVVKNCLFKVLKISNINQLGDHIVVQGGTFRNDAVYRALELLSGKKVSSTNYPELMGAFGAALYAKTMYSKQATQTQFADVSSLPDLNSIQTKELWCHGCNNKCSVLRFKFPNGNISYAGNKCEKVFFSKGATLRKGYNAFEFKNQLLFDRPQKEPSRERLNIGIPRVLNMFENYPFWHTLLTECGFDITLSPESTFQLYQRGIGSVMSDNICFPAKVVHGHILALIDQKVDRIFYPIIPKDEKEFENTNNSYNCPVVSGYPDVIRSAMDTHENYGIPFDKPVINFGSDQALKVTAYNYLKSLGVSKRIFDAAFKLALKARKSFKKDLYDVQKEIMDKAIANKELIFVVAGRPYHTDSLIHQKIGQILSDLGVHVITDDVFFYAESSGFKMLNLVSQWSYPNRVVLAAMEVAKLPENVQLVQLNSFGCGPDSFFMDETSTILKQAGKNHTVLRIDEIASPGSIRLRLRSQIESLRAAQPHNINLCGYMAHKTPYTEQDKQKIILAPWFADFLSPFIPIIGELAGYKIVNMPKTSKESAEKGLIYGNNEVCYPSTLILGDIINTLQSGEYDVNNVVIAITQTGGQCRATNYLSQIKSGLINAGYMNIPVVVIGTGEVFQNDQRAFKLPLMSLINIIAYTLLYADNLQQMYNSVVVREVNSGDTQRLFDHYIEKAIVLIRRKDHKSMLPLLQEAIEAFNAIEVDDRDYTKIGLIGEIYVKYNNYGQAHITEWLRSKGMEVVTPPIIDFFIQYFVNSQINHRNHLNRDGALMRFLKPYFWQLVNKRIELFESCMEHFRFHVPTESIFKKSEYASEILDLSNQFGEGWSIAGEIASYARQGVNKVVCVQPFGCIANHIVAKGIEKRIKKIYPDMHLLYLDIDGGMAEVNLQNRLHFLIHEASQ